MFLRGPRAKACVTGRVLPGAEEVGSLGVFPGRGHGDSGTSSVFLSFMAATKGLVFAPPCAAHNGVLPMDLYSCEPK